MVLQFTRFKTENRYDCVVVIDSDREYSRLEQRHDLDEVSF